MNRILLVLLFAPMLSWAQSPVISWDPPVTVADGSTYGYSGPKVNLTANDIPIVTWGGGSPTVVWSARWNGTSFNTPVQVSPSGLPGVFASSVDPAQAATNGDEVYVTYFTWGGGFTGHIYVHRSLDGGVTWTDSIRADDPDILYRSFAPTVKIDDSGNPVIVYEVEQAAGTNPEQVEVMSTDGGATWTPEVFATAGMPNDPCECCQPDVAISGNTHIVVFRNNISNIRDAYASFSTDGGSSFPFYDDVDAHNWNIAGCPANGPKAIITGDTLVTTWMSAYSGLNRIMLSAYNHATQSLGWSQQLDPVASGSQLTSNIDAVGDTIAIVFSDSRTGDTDIRIVSSISGASGFGPSTVVNASTSGFQEYPDIAYRNGSFHVVYEDWSTGDVIYQRGTISGWTGVGDLSEETMQLSVYPNPAGESVRVSYPFAQYDVTVYDALGKIALHVSQYQDESEIVLNLEPGTYQVVAMAEDGVSRSTSMVVE